MLPCGRVSVIKAAPVPSTAIAGNASLLVRATRYATIPQSVSMVSKKNVCSVMMCFTFKNGSNDATKARERTKAPRGSISRAVK